MKRWLRLIEHIVDKIIPFLLIVLLFVIIGEFFFHAFMEQHRLLADAFDGFIILVFVIDLLFKYARIRNISKFLRASWIDILAIFPFFIFFRLAEGIVGVGETVTSAQRIVHAGVEFEKEFGAGVRSVREGEILLKEGTRAERFFRFLRPLGRSVRFFKLKDPKIKKKIVKGAKKWSFFEHRIAKAVHFYEKPSH